MTCWYTAKLSKTLYKPFICVTMLIVTYYKGLHMETFKRLTFVMPERLKKRFHQACIENSETMGERATKLIEQWLEQQDKAKKGGKK